MKEKFAAHYVMYQHDMFLEDSIESVYPHVDQILIARSTKPWFGEPSDLTETEIVLERIMYKYGNKVEIFQDEFKNEEDQRNFLLELSLSRKYTGAFIVDCDEVFIQRAFQRLYQIIEYYNPSTIVLPYFTFIKDAGFCVAPPYETNLFYVRVDAQVHFTYARQLNIDRDIPCTGIPAVVNFAVLRETDVHIWRKVTNFMHAKDIDWEKWFNEVYMKLTPSTKNFHPVFPENWSGLEHFNRNLFPNNLYIKLIDHNKFDVI